VRDDRRIRPVWALPWWAWVLQTLITVAVMLVIVSAIVSALASFGVWFWREHVPFLAFMAAIFVPFRVLQNRRRQRHTEHAGNSPDRTPGRML
jgi:uncharacterized membrane protein YdjX (TVP38/TMEM64 family)